MDVGKFADQPRGVKFTKMIDFRATIFCVLFASAVFASSTASAEVCSADRIRPIEIGRTYNINLRVKESEFFQYTFSTGRSDAFHGITIIQKPAAAMLVTQAYAIGGSINSVGRYQIIFRVDMSQDGKVGSMNVVANVEVVKRCKD